MSDYTTLDDDYPTDDQWRRGRWETVAVTALGTEWTNVFYAVRGDEFWFERCPAILLQELRGALRVVNKPRRTSHFSSLLDDEVGITRTVFATVDANEGLRAADHVASYVTTVPGGEPDDATRADLLYAAYEDGRIELPEAVAARLSPADDR